MWLLHLLPMGLIAIIVHGILLLGVVALAASYIVRYIPTIGIYALPVRIASIAILVVAVYLEGVYGTHMWYQDQVKDLQAAVAKSEEQSKTLNTELSTAIQKDTVTIKDHTNTVHTEVVEKLVPIDKDCTLDPMVVTVLNHGATSPLNTAAKAQTPAQGDQK